MDLERKILFVLHFTDSGDAESESNSASLSIARSHIEDIHGQLCDLPDSHLITYSVTVINSNLNVIAPFSHPTSPWLPANNRNHTKDHHIHATDENANTITATVDFSRTETPQTLGARLHELADALPRKACLVDVVLGLSRVAISDDDDCFLPLYSALKRLVVWHDAKISSLDGGCHGLEGLIPMRMCGGLNEAVGDHPWWRGKITVATKEGSRRLSLGGVSLTFDANDLGDESRKVRASFRNYLKNARQMDDSGLEFARTIQILEEFPCSAIPSFYLLPYSMIIRQFTECRVTSAFLDALRSDTNVGYIARLGYWYRDGADASCGGGPFGTKVWKESIISNITAANESDESMSVCGYLHFLITSSSSPQNPNQCTAYVLRSPWELNPETIRCLYPTFSLNNAEISSQSKMSSAGSKNLDDTTQMCHHVSLDDPESQEHMCQLCSLDSSDAEQFNVKDIPTLLPEFFDSLSRIPEIEMNLFRKWIDFQQTTAAGGVYLTRDEVIECATDIRYAVIRRHFTCHDSSADLPGYETKQTMNETLCGDLKQTPEYHSLLGRESDERRVLVRCNSLDSVTMSSPFQREDANCEPVGSNDIHLLFNKDGSALRVGSSEPIKTKGSFGVIKMSSVDHSELTALNWPDCKAVTYHGIHYNRQSEKLEARYCKLRDRFVTNETATSMSKSTLVLLTRRPSTTTLRRRSSRSCPSDAPERPSHSEKRNRENVTPKSGDKTTKRRKIPERRRGHGQPLSAIKARTSDWPVAAPIGPPTKPATATKVSPNTVSLSDNDKSVDEASATERKTTRSQRHKQKLLEVVKGVLETAGVAPSDPIYATCATKLYQTTKIMVMDLPTSVNLRQQMTQIAKSQVKQVLYIARQKLKSKSTT